MKTIWFAVIAAFFGLCGGIHAANLAKVVRAQSGHYEAEAYLASEHLVTQLRLSQTPGKRPLILALAGSSGGFAFDRDPEKISHLLSRGYHVLLSAYYFPNPPQNAKTPNKLSRIRLESFIEQLREYLVSAKTAPLIDEKAIGILGNSKGGELALLLGSIYSQFKFIVAVVPSNVTFQATNTTLAHHSAWTLHGLEVDFVPYPTFSLASIYGLITSLLGPSIANFTWMHEEALKNQSAVDKAIIKVERINGPVFILSGTRDQWWPSTAMSRQVMKRLGEQNFPHLHASSHLEYDTDHFPLTEQPDAWHSLLAKLDQMVEYNRAREIDGNYLSNQIGFTAD